MVGWIKFVKTVLKKKWREDRVTSLVEDCNDEWREVQNFQA